MRIKSLLYKFIKNRKFKKSNISYIFDKTLALYVICEKCSNKDEEKESIETLRIIGLIDNMME